MASFVLDLLRIGVGLLLALLGATAETEDKVEGGLLLDVVVSEGVFIELLILSRFYKVI